MTSTCLLATLTTVQLPHSPKSDPGLQEGLSTLYNACKPIRYPIHYAVTIETIISPRTPGSSLGLMLTLRLFISYFANCFSQAQCGVSPGTPGGSPRSIQPICPPVSNIIPLYSTSPHNLDLQVSVQDPCCLSNCLEIAQHDTPLPNYMESDEQLQIYSPDQSYLLSCSHLPMMALSSSRVHGV